MQGLAGLFWAGFLPEGEGGRHPPRHGPGGKGLADSQGQPVHWCSLDSISGRLRSEMD